VDAKHQFGKGYSPKTINNHLAVLHRLFEKAIEYDIIEKNPVTKRTWFRRDRTAEDSREWWTPAEEEKAMALLLGPWHERDIRTAVTLTTLSSSTGDLDSPIPGEEDRLHAEEQARQIPCHPSGARRRAAEILCFGPRTSFSFQILAVACSRTRS
jgi:hypothetical protein